MDWLLCGDGGGDYGLGSRTGLLTSVLVLRHPEVSI